jgi:hypothetical protein
MCAVCARMRMDPAHFSLKPLRLGRFVAATACQGRHETPGTDDPQSVRPERSLELNLLRGFEAGAEDYLGPARRLGAVADA